MSITNNLNFTAKQLKRFAVLFKQARATAKRSQISVATEAFGYTKSHCKVSRVERGVMRRVDAHCLERMAVVLGVPSALLTAIDPRFNARAVIARAATRRGFWLAGAVDASKHL